LKSLELKLERGQPHLVAGFRHWRGFDAIQQETQFSDGTLRLIAILWSLLSLDGLLLLEEPELSLNEEIVKHIPAMLSQVLDEHIDSQVIVTTHSLAIAEDEGLALEEVYNVVPGRNGSKLQRFSDDSGAVDLFKAKLPLVQIVAAQSRAAHQIQTALPL
jgi:predicted ATPase